MKPPRLLIFDFDGVLANTEDLHFAAFAAVLAEEGVTIRREDYFTRYLGLTDTGTLAAAFADHRRQASAADIEALLARKRVAYAERSVAAHLYDGVPATLRALHRGRPLAIASGAFRDEIGSVLERERVSDLFSAIIGAEDVTRGKPAPDPFLRALESVNRRRADAIAAAECIVIEDAPHGVEAARAAGMHCIGVTTSHTRAQLAGADDVIDGVNQLPRLEWLA